MAESILVTGGAGYVGSVCVAMLLERGYRVTVYDNLVTGHPEAVGRGAAFERGDLADRDRLSRVVAEARPDFVMHFAASCLVGESFVKPMLYYRNNVANGANLVEVMLEHGVGAIVFSSSCAVYGEPRETPMTEDHPKEPINPYGRTKLAFEQMLADCDAAHDLKSVCLRYFNAAGATAALGEDHEPETHIIPNVLRVALGKTPVVNIFGADYPTPDGTCVRDYVHVADLAEAHVAALALLREGTSDRLNLGNGSGFSVLEVVNTAAEVAGVDIPFKISERRMGDPAVLVANADRARRVLGWEPAYVSLEGIIESAWEWCRANPDGYGSSNR